MDVAGQLVRGIGTVLDGTSLAPLETMLDAAKSVVSGLLLIAEKVPLVGRCAAVMKDIFALYKVHRPRADASPPLCMVFIFALLLLLSRRRSW